MSETTRRDAYGELKVIRERLKKNYTTSFYLRTLDDVLLNAMRFILTDTNAFDAFVTRAAGWNEYHFRRRISMGKREDFLPLLFQFLSSSGEDRIVAFSRMRMDRGLLIKFLDVFIKDLEKTYIPACNATLKVDGKDATLDQCLEAKKSVEKHYACRTKSLLPAYNEAKIWCERAKEFRGMVLEKYTRLTINTAQRDQKAIFGNSIQLNDLIQNYLLVTGRAIDRADYRCGTLTSFIQRWFFSGRERSTRAKDGMVSDSEISTISYEGNDLIHEIPSDYKPEGNRTAQEEDFSFRLLLKVADPVGAARTYFSVPEILLPGELSKFPSES